MNAVRPAIMKKPFPDAFQSISEDFEAGVGKAAISVEVLLQAALFLK
jgi:hypothetical protein